MAQKIRKVGRPQNLYMEAMRSIKESIFNGEFKPGQSLPNESQLSDLLGVSRPVLREALRALQIQGLLDIRRGNQGGTFVREMDNLSFQGNLEDLIRLRRISVTELSQARLLIEPEVFRLAATSATDEQLSELGQILEETDATRDIERHLTLGFSFHRLVAKSCGNVFYALLMDTIMDFMSSFLRNIQSNDIKVFINLYDQESHAEVYKALADRDGERASEKIKRHIKGITARIINLEKEWLEATEQ
ncbi:MAG: FadR/GntR family transcriptional regulator [Desulfobacteraceae bacterium]